MGLAEIPRPFGTMSSKTTVALKKGQAIQLNFILLIAITDINPN
ncbi:hypothetical protein DSUL_20257 [Desulfovibrionales bacterium]